jgi:hypothetical protein
MTFFIHYHITLIPSDILHTAYYDNDMSVCGTYFVGLFRKYRLYEMIILKLILKIKSVKVWTGII